jgi:ABC-type phosphate/phosphonate transport system substrate-binding protein
VKYLPLSRELEPVPPVHHDTPAHLASGCARIGRMNWIASLPMYNVTPVLASHWRALLADTLRVAAPGARIEDRGSDLYGLWRDDRLLLAQTCGYPLMHSLAGAVQVVATPHFDAPGCDGLSYRSVLVVRADAPYPSLEACRGARAAFNQDDSNSGMKLFRHAVAPLARGGRFFGSVLQTGSHLASLQALAEGRADVAAIDCVTFAFVQDGLPALAAAVRGIGWTAPAPGLPLVAARTVPAALIESLRGALDIALQADPDRARALHLKGFSVPPAHAYDRIVTLEQEAEAAGYPHLA